MEQAKECPMLALSFGWVSLPIVKSNRVDDSHQAHDRGPAQESSFPNTLLCYILCRVASDVIIWTW